MGFVSLLAPGPGLLQVAGVTQDEAYGSHDKGSEKKVSRLGLSLFSVIQHLNQTLGNISLGSHLQKQQEEPRIPNRRQEPSSEYGVTPMPQRKSFTKRSKGRSPLLSPRAF